VLLQNVHSEKAKDRDVKQTCTKRNTKAVRLKSESLHQVIYCCKFGENHFIIRESHDKFKTLPTLPTTTLLQEKLFNTFQKHLYIEMLFT